MTGSCLRKNSFSFISAKFLLNARNKEMIRQHYIWKVIVLNNGILRGNLAKGTKISCVSRCEKKPAVRIFLRGSQCGRSRSLLFRKMMTTWWSEIGSRLLHQRSGQSSEFVTKMPLTGYFCVSSHWMEIWSSIWCERRFATFIDAQLFHEMRVRCPFNGVFATLGDGTATWRSRSALTPSGRSDLEDRNGS